MGSTSASAWKRAESAAGALFGAKRRPLSGSSNRDDIDGDDTLHPRLWIESKLRATHSAYTLWRETKAAARKAQRPGSPAKTPVLVLREKHAPGALVVIHEDNMTEVCVEWLASLDDHRLIEVEAGVRARREEGGA